jgi:hypothetical protein
MPQPNPFSALIDPAAVLAACEASGKLSTLPVMALNRADRRRSWLADDVARFDALIDALVEVETCSDPSSPGRRRPHRKAQR